MPTNLFSFKVTISNVTTNYLFSSQSNHLKNNFFFSENQTSECNELSKNVSRVENTCIFCHFARKKVKGSYQTLSQSTDESLKEQVIINATALEDQKMIEQLQLYIHDEPLYYHKLCKLNYLKQYSLKPRKNHTDWHIIRDSHNYAFNEIVNIVKEEIVESKNCLLLNFILHVYKCAVAEQSKIKGVEWNGNVKPRYLFDKLNSKLVNQIQLKNVENKLVVMPLDVNTVSEECLNKLLARTKLQESALLLRNEILSIEKRPLPDELTASDLIAGECDIPENVDAFNRWLYAGSFNRHKTDSLNRKVRSHSQDMISGVTNGRIKTSKHICLGLSLKSITSSRKVVDLLNKYGHCSSYHVIEELETEATYTSNARSLNCPDDIILSPEYHTCVAFDNLDMFCETYGGKDTMHDTVGIIYQHILPTDQNDENNIIEQEVAAQTEVCAASRNKRRRTFDAVCPEIESYSKTLKLKQKLLPIDHELRVFNKSTYDFSRKIDVSWLLSQYSKVPMTPMWVGFNSKIVIDDSFMQKISYLTPINASPTDKKVVYETMRLCLLIAHECNQKSIQVTYDLAIAKIAFLIQSIESPLFDHLFIRLGDFHIQIAYFRCIGKFIEDSGITHMMIEADILAPGSVNAFIKGKHFNRCRKLHPLVALAIQILHFEDFLERYDIAFNENVIKIVYELQHNKIDKKFFNDPNNAELNDVICKYLKHVEQTLNGDFGKTPQFLLMYVEYVNNYQMLSRSIRVGDFELYKYMLSVHGTLFFTFNAINYSRWLLWYLNKLLSLCPQTHPEVFESLKNGYIGIKRTDKPFSRIAVDLTLEQTINADAARRLTGVTYMTNSIGARQKWCKSHSIRSTILTHTYDDAGYKKSTDITSDLEPHNINKNRKKLDSLLQVFRSNGNPFDPKRDKDLLYNIGTGKSVSNEISDFLLNANVLGERLKSDFIVKCSESENHFESRMSLNKILNFASANIKQKVTNYSTTKEIRMQRDLFGRIAFIALEHETDMQKVLSFPLTPVPTSLCHFDGTICKTTKSQLTKVIAPLHEHDPTLFAPSVLLIDGFFFLHTMVNVPQTYATIAKQILTMILKTPAKEIHLIFDQYFSPSIKDYERNQRGNDPNQRAYHTLGPYLTRSANFQSELTNSSFKIAFVQFLIEYWKNDELAPFFANKTLYVNFDYCYVYKANNNIVEHSEYEIFSCPRHEEADTKLVHHICNIQYKANVLIKCSDTDILVILLGNMHRVHPELKIHVLLGVSATQRIIDINDLYSTLSPNVCKALPAFHAFTGCDYNPSFYRKAKARPYNILTSSTEFVQAFSDLSDQSCDIDRTLPIIDTFICRVYTQPKSITSVNVARYTILAKRFKVKKVDESFNKKLWEKVDSTCLPPCQSELKQQLLRAHYIATIWGNAHEKIPTELKAEDCGWKRTEAGYEYLWFEGDQWPQSIRDVIVNNDEDIVDDNADTGINYIIKIYQVKSRMY